MVRETYCLDRLFDWEKKKPHKKKIVGRWYNIHLKYPLNIHSCWKIPRFIHLNRKNDGIMDRTWLVDGSDIFGLFADLVGLGVCSEPSGLRRPGRGV